MLVTLRPYQEIGVSATVDAVRTSGRPILCAPTGSGKTVCAVEIVNRVGVPTLFMAHRREIIHQAAASLARGGLDVGALMAGMESRPRAQVQVASVQTLRKRAKPPAGLIVVDECHHARAKSWAEILAEYPGVPVVGLSATPWRLDGRGLGDIFDSIIVAAYPADLCNDGTLVEPIVYAPAVPDLSGIHIEHGEYNLRESSDRMRKPKLVGDLVSTWRLRADGRRTVVYALTIEHSKQIEAAFLADGVKIEHLDGGTPKAQRDAILHRLRIDYTTIVTNVQVLDEGWDLPELECAIDAAPTASLQRHLQRVGRIMRSAEGKGGAVVLDHAGNHLRHGPVTQRIDYSLADSIAGAGRNGGGSPLKRCPACYLVVKVGSSECPECGHRFVGREIEHVDGELVRFGAPPPERPRPGIADQQRAWDVLESQRLARGYREGWSFFRFEERFNFRPLVHNGVVCDPATVGRDVKLAIYENFEKAARERGLKHGWAAHRYREIFGVWPRFGRVMA